MSKPLTADQIVAAVKRWGIPYREYTGWRARGLWRSERDGFDPRALTVHHTAGDLGGRTPATYIRDIIVGPKGAAVPDKAPFVVAPDGVLWLVAAGRCNHMAHVNQAGLDAITAATLPLDRNSSYRGSGINGNRYAYGVECIAAGVPNAAQRKTAVLLAAALCDAHGWGGRETHGHGEMSYDRSNAVGPAGDPGWHMGDFRRDVMALVKAGPGTAPAPSRPSLSTTTVALAQQAIITADAAIAKAEAQRAAALKVLAPVLAALKEQGYADYSELQTAMGYTGADADGIAGRSSLAKLMTGYTITD